ncbi:GPI mannosyltransferase 1 [Aspergillus nanangensis]|uniref:GPI mannosyltransferase 1 n=1 Tax=Aspergillus nanangensis TaxID=2582783 RepID=A0AAD4CYV9_ASPNN|nr:GPI mannosyltransferase 1 [Aspergillus nanangensis]
MPSSFFQSPTQVYGSAILLRASLLLYGLWQDAHSPVKYTDIDYLVFTDAARYVSLGQSPYLRDTYRYTPLLAWLLVPTTWNIPGFFSFGKVLFALSDVVAGWLIARSLVKTYGLHPDRARMWACVWLLNPMVANISTRGSSEGLLCALVVGLVCAVLERKVTCAGVLLGLAVHLKIYPFVYGGAVLVGSAFSSSSSSTLKANRTATTTTTTRSYSKAVGGKGEEDEDNNEEEENILSFAYFLAPNRLLFTLTALATFSALNISMYILYDAPFLQHTYLHHVTRIDHRHNFSPYATLLYLSAADGVKGAFESLAFVPQLLLAVVVIPLTLARRSLPGTMLAQTFAFVTFNKYFLWYLVFLPFYLPQSSLIRSPRLGLAVLAAWVGTQALWLQQGYNLEFLGQSSFVPGLFLASLSFFAVNVWILGILISDLGALPVL